MVFRMIDDSLRTSGRFRQMYEKYGIIRNGAALNRFFFPVPTGTNRHSAEPDGAGRLCRNPLPFP